MNRRKCSAQTLLISLLWMLQCTLAFRPSPWETINSRSFSVIRLQNHKHTHLTSNYNYWEGDDMRWRSKWRRRIRRSLMGTSSLPARNTIVLANLFFFIYQTISTIMTLKQRFPSYWPQQALSMILDTVIGSTVQKGSFTKNWVFHPIMARSEPHRYLTSGFLHGGMVHFLLNMDALRRMPNWLETGLGPGLYVSTFLASIVTGNVCHAYFDDFKSACLGASGGIMGLYGLMYVCLVRMGNARAAWLVLRGLAWLLVYGFVVGGISNAAHFGGFLGGLVMGILFGPRYRSSYALLRKNSLEVDDSPRDYRSAMGLGVTSTAGMFPLSLFWIVCGILLLSRPSLRNAPLMALRGLGL